MLTLLLLRHAKSSWEFPALADYDRPLAKRGQKAAPRMGAEIATLGLRPDLVLCSGAARTRETLDLILPALGNPSPEIVYDDALYMSPPVSLLKLLQKLGADGTTPQTVMLVGHNPGIEELAELLIGGGDAAAHQLLQDKFPTCALAVVNFDAKSWRDIAPSAGSLSRFITPARLT